MFYDCLDVSAEEQSRRNDSEEAAEMKQELQERLLQLEHNVTQLKTLNKKMEEEMTHNSECTQLVKVLRSEKNSLCEQKKMLSRSLKQLCQTEDEVKETWDRLSEEKSSNRHQESQIREMKKELKMLEEEGEEITAEVASLQTQREKDQDEIKTLQSALQVLQRRMTEVQLDLRQKDGLMEKTTLQHKEKAEELDELHATIQELRQNHQDLTTELEGRQEEELLAQMENFIAGDGPYGYVESMADDDAEPRDAKETTRDDKEMTRDTKSWQRRCAEEMAKGAMAAGVFTVFCLTSVAVLAFVLPHGLSVNCDFRWADLVEPYCHLYQLCARPF